MENAMGQPTLNGNVDSALGGHFAELLSIDFVPSMEQLTMSARKQNHKSRGRPDEHDVFAELSSVDGAVHSISCTNPTGTNQIFLPWTIILFFMGKITKPSPFHSSNSRRWSS
jgi:hypothetical protein